MYINHKHVHVRACIFNTLLGFMNIHLHSSESNMYIYTCNVYKYMYMYTCNVYVYMYMYTCNVYVHVYM